MHSTLLIPPQEACMQISEYTLRQVINHFAIEGSLTSIEVNKEGHINSTFFTTFTNEGSVQKYTHQRINTLVFKQPVALMENVSLVTSHIRSKLIGHYDNVDQRCLRVIPTRSGANVYVDEDGGYWRTYQFIDHVKTFKTIADAEQAYLLGEAIGNSSCSYLTSMENCCMKPFLTSMICAYAMNSLKKQYR